MHLTRPRRQAEWLDLGRLAPFVGVALLYRGCSHFTGAFRWQLSLIATPSPPTMHIPDAELCSVVGGCGEQVFRRYLVPK